MFYKNLMSEYVYRLVMGYAIAASPFLQNPIVQALFNWLAETWLLPGFLEAGKYLDFINIDKDAAKDNKDYQDGLKPIHDIDSGVRPIEEIPDEEIKRIRDEFHKNLDKLIKMPKDFGASGASTTTTATALPTVIALAPLASGSRINRRYRTRMSA